MVGEWRETSLGEIIELKRGYDLPQQLRTLGRVPLVSSSGVTDHHTVAMVKGPGVVTGRYGTLGQVFFVTEDFWPLNTTLYVRDFKGNDPRFISYFLRTVDFQAYSDKAAVPGLNRNHLHQARVRVPNDIAEQRAIAHILGTLDDKIELNRRMNATLEALARALFKSWFVDFDPVRANMQRKDAGAQWRKDHPLASLRPGVFALSPGLADLFPDEFEASEVGMVPRGWRVGTLDDFAALNPESWSKTTLPMLIRYVDLTNTKWGRIEAVTEYTQQDAPSRAQRVLRPGDTIIGTVRPGNGSFAYIYEVGLTGSTGFAVLRPRKAHYQEFVYLAATVGNNIGALAHLADGGAYPAVRPEVVGSTQIICPADAILLVFARLTRPLLAKMAQNERDSRTLAALRDALLPKLISGAVRVGEAERFVRTEQG